MAIYYNYYSWLSEILLIAKFNGDAREISLKSSKELPEISCFRKQIYIKTKECIKYKLEANKTWLIKVLKKNIIRNSNSGIFTDIPISLQWGQCVIIGNGETKKNVKRMYFIWSCGRCEIKGKHICAGRKWILWRILRWMD